MPLDIFFNSNKESGHARLLRTGSHHLRNKHDNIFKNNEINKNGKIHNDPVEMCFYEMRSMSGMKMKMSAESFCQNIQSCLLRDTDSLSKNYDGTFSRNQQKNIFQQSN